MVSLLDKDTLALQQHPDWGKSLWGCPPQPVLQASTLYETLLFRPQQLPKKWKCHSKPMWERHISPCCRFPWRFGRKQSRRKATKVHLSYKKLSSHATTAGTVWAAGTIDVPLTSAYCSSWMLSWDSAGAEIPRLWDGRPLKVPHPAPRPNVCLGIPLLLDERDRRYLSSQAKTHWLYDGPMSNLCLTCTS